jgi:hypothetical protein
LAFTACTEIKAAEIHLFGKTVDQAEAFLLIGAVSVQENDAGLVRLLLMLDKGSVEDFTELVGGFEVKMF